MKDNPKKMPHCFGVLENVFPKGPDGLRNTPESCISCIHKVDCLRSAMTKSEGLKVRSEMVDRAYSSGMIGFLGRWSKKKVLQRRINEATRKPHNGGNHEDN